MIRILKSVAGSGVSLKKGQEVNPKGLPKGLAESLLKSGLAELIKPVKRNTKVNKKETAS